MQLKITGFSVFIPMKTYRIYLIQFLVIEARTDERLCLILGCVGCVRENIKEIAILDISIPIRGEIAKESQLLLKEPPVTHVILELVHSQPPQFLTT